MTTLVIVLVLLVLIAVTFFMTAKINKEGYSNYFNVKKILDVSVFLLSYCMFVSLVENQKASSQGSLLEYMYIAGSIAFALWSLYLALSQFSFFSKNAPAAKDFGFYLMMFSVLIELLCAFALIYYSLYSLNSSWFSGVALGTPAETAFEFFYYAFTLSVSYGGNSLSAVGTLPRTVEMLHISLFYLFYADVLIRVFKQSEKEP